MLSLKLWFDVGIKRYTTTAQESCHNQGLWFDVGIKRYTTKFVFTLSENSCGLM